MPTMASITKSAATVRDPAKAGATVHDAIALATEPIRGPVFLDFRSTRSVRPRETCRPSILRRRPRWRPTEVVAVLGALLAGAERPSFVVGSDVYWAGAGTSCRRPSSTSGCRCSPTASAVARCPPTTSSPSCARASVEVACRRRRRARHAARLRLGFGRFGAVAVAHVVDAAVAARRRRRRAPDGRRHRRHAPWPRRPQRALCSTTRRLSPSCAVAEDAARRPMSRCWRRPATPSNRRGSTASCARGWPAMPS